MSYGTWAVFVLCMAAFTCNADAQRTRTPPPTLPPTEAPEGPCEDQTVRPNNLYCAKYEICKDGEFVVFNCSPGLVFNPDKLHCDLPEYAGCHLEGNACPEEGQLVPHESDCSLYYMCSWGSLVQMPCGPDLEFSPEMLYCDYPELSGCTTK